MKQIIILILIIGLSACKILHKKNTNYNIYIENDFLYSIINNRYVGSDTLITDYHESGEIKGFGRYAIDNCDQVSNLKIGEWTEYYENSQIKSKGEYCISTYIQCCFGGYCRQYINYKKGNWKYYYSNGELKATGNYDNNTKHINTSCEGGDTLQFHEISEDKWKCFDESGSNIAIDNSIRFELEKIITVGENITETIWLDSISRNELMWDWN